MQYNDTKDFITLVFEGYQHRKRTNTLYDEDSTIPQQIIKLYYDSINKGLIHKPNFDEIFEKYKRKYIYNESRVDENISENEKKGLAEVYDYLLHYDFNKKKFDIFIEGLQIHCLLYKYCKIPGEELETFGGKLRQSTVFLQKTFLEVPDAEVAKRYFQSYCAKPLPELDLTKENGIFDYIDTCVDITAELIRYQPFQDGNKRTFRSILNLLFKRVNLPPVYIKTSEKEEYKDCLLEGMENQDYSRLKKFYYYKICDSIYDLDVVPDMKHYIEEKQEEKKRY